MKVDIQSMNAQDEDKILAMLPTQLAELAHLMGLSATLVLIDRFGGVSLDIPHSLDGKNGAWLVRELGSDIAQVLVNRHKGEKVYINNCDALRVYLRNIHFANAIFAKMETGTAKHRAVQETAPLFGITERRAYDILKEMTAQHSQLDLF